MQSKTVALLIFLLVTSNGIGGEYVVKLVDLPVVYQAVGTVHSSVEAKVMAQTSGRVTNTLVGIGAVVQKGNELATIEDKELTLRRKQAESGVELANAQVLQAEHGRLGASAALSRARSEYTRVKKMHIQKAATDQQLEQAEAAFKQAEASVAAASEAIKAAKAAVNRANAAVEEVEVALGYTKVQAPFDGLITRKLVDPGDLAWPGRPLFELIDESRRRLEANVREGLAGHISVGEKLPVHIPSMDLAIEGTVEEVSPSADPSSRTFTVKVGLGDNKNLLPGMFGRLDVPTGTKKVVYVPRKAIGIMGQLRLVRIKDGNTWRRRLIRLGEVHADGFVVLAGLIEGETIAPSYEEVR